MFASVACHTSRLEPLWVSLALSYSSLSSRISFLKTIHLAFSKQEVIKFGCLLSSERGLILKEACLLNVSHPPVLDIVQEDDDDEAPNRGTRYALNQSRNLQQFEDLEQTGEKLGIERDLNTESQFFDYFM